jgi:serine/threonine protein kinase
MAPEQWEGKPADTRSDIYAFGCVLYGMLTGKRVGQGPLAGLEAHRPPERGADLFGERFRGTLANGA